MTDDIDLPLKPTPTYFHCLYFKPGYGYTPGSTLPDITESRPIHYIRVVPDHEQKPNSSYEELLSKKPSSEYCIFKDKDIFIRFGYSEGVVFIQSYNNDTDLFYNFASKALGSERENFLDEVSAQIDDLLADIRTRADEIGGPFRAPGIRAQAREILVSALKSFR